MELLQLRQVLRGPTELLSTAAVLLASNAHSTIGIVVMQDLACKEVSRFSAIHLRLPLMPLVFFESSTLLEVQRSNTVIPRSIFLLVKAEVAYPHALVHSPIVGGLTRTLC